MTRRLRGLLDEHPYYHHASASGRDLDGPRDSVSSLHAHLPQLAFQMLYMRLAHPFETMALNQFDNPAKTRLHIGRESFKLISNANVEQFNDPMGDSQGNRNTTL